MMLTNGRTDAQELLVRNAEEKLDQILATIDPECAITDGSCLMNVEVGITDAVRLSHQLAAHSGWWLDTETGEDVRSWPKKFFLLWVSTKLALVHSEVSESLEGWRKDLMDDKLSHRKMIEVELADAAIRIFDLAGGLDLDLSGAILEKLAFNQHRPDHKLEHRLAEGGKQV